MATAGRQSTVALMTHEAKGPDLPASDIPKPAMCVGVCLYAIIIPARAFAKGENATLCGVVVYREERGEG